MRDWAMRRPARSWTRRTRFQRRWGRPGGLWTPAQRLTITSTYFGSS